MKKWEYKFFYFDKHDMMSELERKFNGLGRDGWELAVYVEKDYANFVIFKKEY